MQQVILERFAYMPVGTLGRLRLPNGDTLFTVERPWLNNKRNQSCIPEGQYTVEHYSSDKFPDAYHVQDVPDRSYILFHSANYPNQVEGCIAPGLTLSPGQIAVQNSRTAMSQLLDAMDRQTFVLTVTHKEAIVK